MSRGDATAASAETKVPADFLLTHAGELLTMAEPAGLGLISDGAVAAAGGRIVWVGRTEDALTQVAPAAGATLLDTADRVVMPGLVDCHTHLVFAGLRAQEFQMRVAGLSYEEITRAGGGIMSTVSATRAASTEELLGAALRHLDWMLGYGITTVEAKTGYGLTLEEELRLLEVTAEVDRRHSLTVVPTFLGAHVVPLEYRVEPGRYVDLVVEEMLPAVAEQGIARFCDVFCEDVAFSLNDTRRILEAGLRYGLRPKLHAEQLSTMGSAELAAELGAVSADHLDRISDSGIEAMAAAGTVGVLLPGAVLFLGLTEFAPARRMLAAGMRLAVSTDFNPGTSYSENLFLMGTIASCYLKLRVDEVLRAITFNAAAALNLEHEIGSLEVGKRADIIILDTASHLDIPYHFGVNPVLAVVKDGALVLDRRKSP